MEQSSLQKCYRQKCFKATTPLNRSQTSPFVMDQIIKPPFLNFQVTTLKLNCESKLMRRGRRGRVEGCQWTAAEEQKLLQLHDKVGNRWSYISKCFAGRTDNSIKNHFFSRLRMSLRYLYQQLGKASKLTKTIPVQSLYKIISVFDESFNKNPVFDEELIGLSADLKNRLFNYFYTEQTQDHIAFQLAKDIYRFSSHFHKRKRQQNKVLGHQEQAVHEANQCPYAYDEETIEKTQPLCPNNSQGEVKVQNQQPFTDLLQSEPPQYYYEDNLSEVPQTNLEKIDAVQQHMEKSPFVYGSNPFLSFNLILSPEDYQVDSAIQHRNFFCPSDCQSPFLLSSLRHDSQRD